MKKVNGENHKTISDGAAHFGVAVKTVRDWIKKEIISEPPKVKYGAGFLDIYPNAYLEKASAELEAYRNNNRSK